MANDNELGEANALLLAEQSDSVSDDQGASKRPDAKDDVKWHIAMRPTGRALDKRKPADTLIDDGDRLMTSVRSNVEHPFRVVERQFGHVKVRYRSRKEELGFSDCS